MRAERVQEWKKEWRKEGIQEGTSSLLQQLLEQKFGRLSDGVINRLHSADDQQLQIWAKRILTVETLNEIFDN